MRKKYLYKCLKTAYDINIYISVVEYTYIFYNGTSNSLPVKA